MCAFCKPGRSLELGVPPGTHSSSWVCSLETGHSLVSPSDLFSLGPPSLPAHPYPASLAPLSLLLDKRVKPHSQGVT